MAEPYRWEHPVSFSSPGLISNDVRLLAGSPRAGVPTRPANAGTTYARIVKIVFDTLHSSPTTRRTDAAASRPHHPRPHAPSSNRRRDAHRAGPVSYTHLRAHETRHD